MINLLPPKTKMNLAYARKNSSLLKYCFFILSVIFCIALVSFAGGWYIKQSRQAHQQQLEQSKKAIESRQLGSVQKEAEDIAENIKLTTDVLSKEVLFSKLLKQIGSVMPANTSLSDLKIDTDETTITLAANALDYTTATQIQINLSDPENKIFKSADILNINCDGSAERYPCTVNLTALLGDEKSYLFIESGEKK